MIYRRFGILLVALAVFVAACGDDDESASDDSTTSTESDSGTENEEAADGGTLRFAYYVDISRWDPHRSSTGQDLTWLAPVYDRLVHVSPEGEAIPGLAESWEFVDDGSALEMTLRSDVVFHDGATFDAEAVQANLERARDLDDSTVATDLEVVESVEVVDESTVRLHLAGPASTLPLVLSDRAGMMISPDAMDSPDLDSSPVGTGAFTLASYSDGDTAVYERFDDYWDAENVSLDGMEFVLMADSATRLNALRSGEVDATQLDPIDKAAAESAGFELLEGLTTGFVKNQMNRTKEPFDDVRVRQAMNFATDREAIAEALTLGVGVPTNQPFPPGAPGYSEEAAELYPYDPDQARDLLEEAGLADGFSFEAIVANTPLRVQAAEAVQAQLAEIGVTMEIRAVEPAQTADIFFGNEEGDTVPSAWSGRPDPLQTIAALYTPGQFTNPGGHTTDEVMAAYEDALENGLPEEERAERVRAVTLAVTEAALDWPIYQDFSLLAFDESVSGLAVYVSGKPEFRGVSVG